jgi:hypothetical protein
VPHHDGGVAAAMKSLVALKTPEPVNAK